VLRVVDGLKVFRNLGFDKVTQFGHLLTAEKRVVRTEVLLPMLGRVSWPFMNDNSFAVRSRSNL
jgi:hypothetical protein